MPILVLNDEGHHCWRPASEDEELTAEERRELEEEEEEARVWLEGLDQINNVPYDQFMAAKLAAARRGSTSAPVAPSPVLASAMVRRGGHGQFKNGNDQVDCGDEVTKGKARFTRVVGIA